MHPAGYPRYDRNAPQADIPANPLPDKSKNFGLGRDIVEDTIHLPAALVPARIVQLFDMGPVPKKKIAFFREKTAIGSLKPASGTGSLPPIAGIAASLMAERPAGFVTTSCLCLSACP